MIRNFEQRDMPEVMRILVANGLDEKCLPDLEIKDQFGKTIQNPLFVVKAVYEKNGQTAMMCFLKVRSELYFFVDHEVGTPEERWEWLKEFKEHMVREAYHYGLDQMTAFIPPDIDESFSKRLLDLGFEKSPWVPYSLNIG